MLKVLITGCSGYVATSLISRLKDRYNITAIGRKDFDLANREATNNWFEDKQFDAVVHTACIIGGRLVRDEEQILTTNLKMFFNLINNKDKFSKLINLGSGAETNNPDDYYGMSKNIIKRFIDVEHNFFNLRIFGLFDQNEANTRFIKSNIDRYLRNEPMIINQNRLIDYFYIEDLCTLIVYYIEQTNLYKNIDCVYDEKYTLIDIANIINQQGIYKVPIEILKDGTARTYQGSFNLPINTVGLLEGIKTTFQQLQSRHNQL
jgi:nucleoside-diphosphate-sugar epimerase